MPSPCTDVIVGGCRIGEKIGQGSFGELYLATDVQTGEKYAAKMVGQCPVLPPIILTLQYKETIDTKNPQLFYEYKVYGAIKKGMGVPKVHYFGVTSHHNVMIMDLLGQSLESLFNICSVLRVEVFVMC